MAKGFLLTCVDNVQLQQVAVNLIGNSKEAMQLGIYKNGNTIKLSTGLYEPSVIVVVTSSRCGAVERAAEGAGFYA